MRIHAKDKFDTLAVPTIQLAGQGEIGIPTQGNLSGMLSDYLNSPIYPRHAPFMTDRIARPVNQVEHLSSVRQRDNQRRITPDPFVGKPNASFAFSKRRSNGAIGINKGVGKSSPRAALSRPAAECC